MANRAGAFALVVGGAVIAYSAYKGDSVIDTLLMRGGTTGTSTGTASGTTGSDSTSEDASYTVGAGSSPLREAVITVCEQSVAKPGGTFFYDEVRPIPATLYGPPIPVKTDCSGYATLVYKTAGAPDPNGENYDGLGYTGTLQLHGVATTTPNQGDMAFWNGPAHVGIVGTDGTLYMCGIEYPYVIKTTVEEENANHTSFVGYRSYLPLDTAPNSNKTSTEVV